MNIAFDAGAIEIAKGSGIGNYTLNQLRALVKLYPEHQFYYFNMIEQSNLTDIIVGENFHRSFFYQGKTKELIQYKTPYEEVFVAVLKRFLQENNIDVFYITAPFLSGHIQYKREWFGRTQLLATAYDIIPYIMKKQYLCNKSAEDWYMDCIHMLKQADRQLAISQSVKTDLIEHLAFPEENIDIIYGGVSELYCIRSIEENTKGKIKSKFGISRKFIMCSISADWRKNISGAIAAYSGLNAELKEQYQLVIVGRVLPEALESYQTQIKKLQENENIIITGYVTDEEIVLLYNMAALMLFPSLYEGFGLPVLEAWACGTPVCTSNNSSLGEVTGDAGVVFDPNNVKDITRGLTEALTTADLQDLLEKGRSKLHMFSWNNVARLTMESIMKSLDNGKKQATVPHLVFVIEAPLTITTGMQMLFDAISARAPLTVVCDGVQECKGDYTFATKDSFATNYDSNTRFFYFIVGTLDQYQLKFCHKYPGVLVYVTEKLAKIIDRFAPSGDRLLDIRLAQELNDRFWKKQQGFDIAKFKNVFSTVVVADDEEKMQFLARKINMRIVAMLDDATLTRSTHIKEPLLLNFCNLFLSISCKDTQQETLAHWLECKGKGIVADLQYKPSDIAKLSGLLSYAFCADYAVKTNLTAIREVEDTKLPIVNMVTSWNSKCGVAEFTRYFIESIDSMVAFRIFPDQTDSCIRPDEYFVMQRTWKQGNRDFERLLIALRSAEGSIVHIQYNFGFFKLENIAKLIRLLPHKKIILDFHATKYIDDVIGEDVKNELVNTINQAYRIVVHQSEDVAFLSKFGIAVDRIFLIPLGQPVAIAREKDAVRKMLQIDSKPVIGSYGFLLPHKGVDKVISAIALLKKEFPDIFYIVCCALHADPTSEEYFFKCEKLVKKLHLEENVWFCNAFLQPEESELLLQACDVLTLPYDKTNESASAAVRTCISVCRPLVVTKQDIFKEVASATLQIPTNAPEDIAQGIRQQLREPTERFLVSMQQMIEKNCWVEVGEKYLSLYQSALEEE